MTSYCCGASRSSSAGRRPGSPRSWHGVSVRKVNSLIREVDHLRVDFVEAKYVALARVRRRCEPAPRPMMPTAARPVRQAREQTAESARRPEIAARGEPPVVVASNCPPCMMPPCTSERKGVGLVIRRACGSRYRSCASSRALRWSGPRWPGPRPMRSSPRTAPAMAVAQDAPRPGARDARSSRRR